jgi:hypothetical protein
VAKVIRGQGVLEAVTMIVTAFGSMPDFRAAYR